MEGMDEILREFLVETHEALDEYHDNLSALAAQPDEHTLLDPLFRTLHSIKGTCGFLGLPVLQALTHAAEGLLGSLRDDRRDVTAETVQALAGVGTVVGEILTQVEGDGTEGDGDHQALIQQLERLREGDVEETFPLLGQVLIERGLVTGEQLREALAAQRAGDNRKLGEILVARGHVGADDVLQALSKQTRGRSATEDTIRVDVDLLDRLVRLVGEMAATRDDLLAADEPVPSVLDRLDEATAQLEDAVRAARMQPLASMLGRYHSLVRDLAQASGKSVALELSGENSPVDRAVVEAVKDPLTHLLRNAVDHGMEPPAARAGAGKPRQGHIEVRVEQHERDVVITVTDDGRGIDVQAVRARALERGLVAADELHAMGDEQAVRLVFAPGFSTADAVTTVSGRGVGMDVVLANVERLGGDVSIDTVAGAGTTVRLRIPSAIAAVRTLGVVASGRRCAVPEARVLDVVPAAARHVVPDVSHPSPRYAWGTDLLPLVSLRELLGLPRPRSARGSVVVVAADGQAVALLVDEVSAVKEIVVQPVSGDALFAGTTVIGQRVAPDLLDVPALVRRAAADAAVPV